MTTLADFILSQLKIVDFERARYLSRPQLQTQVALIKLFQQQRFAHTYADLLVSSRYSKAIQFFLNEIYNPNDFSHRDTQFARVVPTMVRLFPGEIVDTVAGLAQLYALSEQLDAAMAEALGEIPLMSGVDYIQAWQSVGRQTDRLQQITLTLNVASQLDKLTQKPLLSHTLRLMRTPAKIAGLTNLQGFLEAGFDTFRAMKGSHEFMSIVDTRERRLMNSLFNVNPTAAPDDPQLQQILAALVPASKK
jgi:hypothetical protein